MNSAQCNHNTITNNRFTGQQETLSCRSYAKRKTKQKKKQMHGAGIRRKMSPPCIKAVANMLPRRTLQNPKPYALQLVLGISSFHSNSLPAPAWQGKFRGDIVKQETNKSSVHIPETKNLVRATPGAWRVTTPKPLS